MQARTILDTLSSLAVAVANCEKSGNAEWRARHLDHVADIMATAPHGSGIDGKVWLRRATASTVEIRAEIHRMNEHGFYDGWRTARICFRAQFGGPSVEVYGQGLDDGWKDMLAETFLEWGTSLYVVPATVAQGGL